MMSSARFGNWCYRVSFGLFVLAAAALVWRPHEWVDFGVHIPRVKPSDVLVLIAAGLFLAAWVLDAGLRKDAERWRFVWRWVKYPLIFAGSAAVGSVWAWYAFGFPTLAAWQSYARLGIGGLFFAFPLVFGFRDAQAVKVLCGAFLSALMLVPILLVSDEFIVSNFLIVSPVSYTLLGFQTSTIVLASYLVIPIAFLGAFCIRAAGYRRIFFALMTAGLTAILLWTGSRGGWLGGAVAIATGFVLAGPFSGPRRWMLALGAVAGFFAAGLLILSPLARNTALLRILPHVSFGPTEVSQDVILRLPTRDFIRRNQGVVDLDFQAGRGDVWMMHLGNTGRNPLGLGAAYDRIVENRNSYGQRVNAHSLWLETALVGGLAGAAAFFLLVARLGRAALNLWRLRPDWLSAGLLAAFAGTLSSATFIDSLDLRWFWLILGMVAAAEANAAADRKQ